DAARRAQVHRRVRQTIVARRQWMRKLDYDLRHSLAHSSPIGSPSGTLCVAGSYTSMNFFTSLTVRSLCPKVRIAALVFSRSQPSTLIWYAATIMPVRRTPWAQCTSAGCADLTCAAARKRFTSADVGQ